MEAVFSSLSAIFSVLVLVVINGYFVASEFALVRSLSTKLKSPEYKDRFGSNAATKLLENLTESISVTQLGITVASLVLGWIGEAQFHKIAVSIFVSAGIQANEISAHAVATALALSAVTFLHVVLGELVAKSIAIRFPETTICLLAPLLLLINKIASPIVKIMSGSAAIFLRIFGFKAQLEGERVHSSGELAALIAQSGDRGILDKDEEQMLQGVFHFSETIAREVMTPRTDLITIPIKSSFQETISIISTSGFSRFPVIEGTVDKVVGVLLSRDLLPVIERYVGPSAKKFSISDIMRHPYYIPATKSIMDLLKEFKKRKLHMAIVLDEHGGVDGAVTLEDLIEEIVGDIYDESDAIETDISIDESSGDIILDGGVLVDDINEQFDIAIPEGEYDTIAGFLMSTLGRMPHVGDKIAVGVSGIAMVIESNIKKLSFVENQITANSDIRSSTDETLDSDDDNMFSPRAILIVERVTGNRVESVRLQLVNEQNEDASSDSGA